MPARKIYTRYLEPYPILTKQKSSARNNLFVMGG